MEDLDKKIIELMDLFDGEVTTVDKIDRPEESLRKEMFEDASERFNKADGGRIPFGEAGFVISDNKEKTKLKFTKKQDDIAEKVYGKSMKKLYETNRNLFHNIRFDRVKETTQAGSCLLYTSDAADE